MHFGAVTLVNKIVTENSIRLSGFKSPFAPQEHMVPHLLSVFLSWMGRKLLDPISRNSGASTLIDCNVLSKLNTQDLFNMPRMTVDGLRNAKL
jgi:hypothetical protein